MNLFDDATSITIRSREIAPFWVSPWKNGMMPKYIAPLIFEVSKKKKCTIKQALVNKGWISNIKMVLV
jgi:hypothetical protein